MKKILLIEDNQSKLEKIKLFLSESFPQFEVEIRTSFNSGLTEIVGNYLMYEFILLDMSMQIYDISNEESGGDPIPLAGKNILANMYYREIPNRVIVITMYENFVDGTKIHDLDKNLADEFPDNYKGYVSFSHSNKKWMEDLKTAINKIL